MFVYGHIYYGQMRLCRIETRAPNVVEAVRQVRTAQPSRRRLKSYEENMRQLRNALIKTRVNWEKYALIRKKTFTYG